ncbi:MAG: glycerol-3-phosphate acyltransferase [Firmicutes bacterium]|nr:glycerol-3-phosphate acyltransferase [Bacillota bacterium]
MFLWLLMTAAGFLSGSVMYAYFIPKWIRGVDVRQGHEDENPGGTNAVDTAGLPIGITCIILDLAKAFAPVFVAVSVLGIRGVTLAPVIVAPVLGHAFSPFMRFKGGKAVASSFGALLGAIGISWAVFILVLAMLIFQFALVLKPNSAKVLAGYACASIAAFLIEPLPEIKIAMLLICFIVCYKHVRRFDSGGIGLGVGPFSVSYEDRELKFAGPGVHKK